MKWGILFRWQSFWIGAHWSPYNRRLCVNLVPFITVWVTAPKGGITPKQGKDIYRSDSNCCLGRATAEQFPLLTQGGPSQHLGSLGNEGR